MVYSGNHVGDMVTDEEDCYLMFAAFVVVSCSERFFVRKMFVVSVRSLISIRSLITEFGTRVWRLYATCKPLRTTGAPAPFPLGNSSTRANPRGLPVLGVASGALDNS